MVQLVYVQCRVWQRYTVQESQLHQSRPVLWRRWLYGSFCRSGSVCGSPMSSGLCLAELDGLERVQSDVQRRAALSNQKQRAAAVWREGLRGCSERGRNVQLSAMSSGWSVGCVERVVDMQCDVWKRYPNKSQGV